MIPLVRYRFIFELRNSLELPVFPGFLFRGALGFALKHSVCKLGEPVKEQQCGECIHRLGCAYPDFFEPNLLVESGRGTSLISYVVQAPPQGRYRVGQTLSFDLLLVGRSVALFPELFAAVLRMLDHGIGPQRAKASLERVTLPDYPGNPLIYQRGHHLAVHYEPMVPDCYSLWGVERVEIELRTPLRMVVRGKLQGPGELTAESFIKALIRRVEQLGRVHVPGWERLDTAAVFDVLPVLQLKEENVCWLPLERYSSRSSAAMRMGGLLGRLVLSGPLEPVMPWLVLGETVHIGKNTVFGLGRYRLTSAS